MKIEIFPANIGDSFLISYGKDYEKHLLIDGGYKETYDNFLKKRLKEISELKQELELVIVTHIDQDHIGGILKLIEENGHSLEKKIIGINEIWHNSYRHLDEKNTEEIIKGSPEEAIIDDIISTGMALFTTKEGNISGYHGSMLASYIYENEYNWNTKFDSKAISINNSTEVIIDNDLKIILLSPSNENLENLKIEWEKHLKRRKMDFKLGKGKKVDDAFEFLLMRKEPEIEDGYFCSYKKSKKWDKIEFPMEDSSKTNASSIAVILETKNDKALFLGDSKPSTIVESLKKLKKEKNYSFNFDIIKISHHGSLKSTSRELIELIDGKNWIFTGNGNNNKPSEDLVRYILEKKKNKFKKFIFNYKIGWLDLVKKIEKEYECKIIDNTTEKSMILSVRGDSDDFR
jgi:ribonuclease BN (tRNA processing enzyme)